MFRLLISSISSVANTLLKHDQNPVNNDPSRGSKWNTVRKFVFAAISSLGLPFFRSVIGNDTLYNYVNTLMPYSTTNRNRTENRQRHNLNISRLSRPAFRRRVNHHGGITRKKPMTRGHQKELARQRNDKGGNAGKPTTQRGTATAALVYQCPVCRTQMGDPKTYKQHFESKHPKSELPPELKDV